jgi:hypothetical protein
MAAAPVPNWRQLAEAASKEPNSAKLLQTVEQLCESLDRHTSMEQPASRLFAAACGASTILPASADRQQN